MQTDDVEIVNHNASRISLKQTIQSLWNEAYYTERNIVLPSRRLKHEYQKATSHLAKQAQQEQQQNLFLRSSKSISNLIQSSRKCLFPYVLEDEEEPVLTVFNSLEDLNNKKSLVIDMGYALTAFGAPAHRLDYFIEMISLNYGLIAEAMCNPTAFWIQFYEARIQYIDNESGDEQNRIKYHTVPRSVHFCKVPVTAYNLTKMGMMEHLATQIYSNTISVEDARKEIKRISLLKHSFYDHFMLVILARFLFAVVVSLLFNANMMEILVSILASLSASALALISRNYPAIGKVNTIITGTISGIIAIVFKLVFHKQYNISVFVVALAGSISLMPGFTIVVAMNEILTNNLVCGTVRMISALVTIMQVTFGILLPQKFASLILLYSELPDLFNRNPVHIWTRLALVPVLVSAFMIFLKAPMKRLSFSFVVTGACLSTTVNHLIFLWTDSREVSTFLAAFAIGCVSQGFSWFSTVHSGMLVRSTCVMFLLPSTLSYRSFNAFLLHDVASGASVLYDVVSMCLSLTLGLAASTIVVPPRKRRKL
jgi:uncharacterized membrane protein YjjP (DUF1212 family)